MQKSYIYGNTSNSYVAVAIYVAIDLMNLPTIY